MFVRWRERRNEVNFINLEGDSNRLGGGEMSVMDGIKCSTQYGNLHVRRDSNIEDRTQKPGARRNFPLFWLLAPGFVPPSLPYLKPQLIAIAGVAVVVDRNLLSR